VKRFGTPHSDLGDKKTCRRQILSKEKLDEYGARVAWLV
jgi:hypothetical protein